MLCADSAAAERTSRPSRNDGGFSLIEVMVACLVLVIGLLVVAQFFASAITGVTDSENRSLLHQVAAQEVEAVRAIPYEDVGTIDGHPAGALLASESRSVQGVNLLITREVTFVEDESYSGPYPANYRRVTIRVELDGDDRLAPVELATLVAGGAGGGSLDITVTDTHGNPVTDVLIRVNNTHLTPHVHIDSTAIRTDSQGHLLIPGLPPDATTSYLVEGSKEGYNGAWTDPMVVVNEGLPYTVIQFVMDLLSTMNIIVVDDLGAQVPGLALSVTGPREFDQDVLTDATGRHTFADIGFSTSSNPYVIAVNAGQGYQPVSASVALEPGVTQDVTIIAPRIIPATTTTAPPATTTTTVVSATTTTASTTTTTLGHGSVIVSVVAHDRWGRHIAIYNAAVTLNGQQMMTNSMGQVTFPNVQFGTYEMLVTKNDYDDYRANVTVDGSETVTVHLVRD